MNIKENEKYVNEIWEKSIISTLEEYIRIPNKSPLFDADWKQHGHMDQAVKLLVAWCQKNAIENMKLEVIEKEGRTPIILIEIPGSSKETILLYGHLDKQPEMSGWDADLGPWKPVLKGDKLYGRGGADDGYSIFAALTAIKSLRAQNLAHPRCVILIEACEESGSRDLPYYIEAFAERIGKPKLIICLDSGCSNYDQLWITTSLRGILSGVLYIDVLQHGMHSGLSSGAIPSCFLVLRNLLSRIEDESNGKILLKDLFVEIPEQRRQQAEYTAKILGKTFLREFPLLKDVQPITHDLTELLLNLTWRPALAVIGGEGLPKSENAGNVTLPSLSFKLSLRLPPTCDAKIASKIFKDILETNPPFGAKVRFEIKESESGWNAPIENPWLIKAANAASKNYFSNDSAYIGIGASIPFMGMLGKKFPQAQFLITGVLGPESNAHGPNEFLHIPMAKKLTCCIAEIIHVAL